MTIFTAVATLKPVQFTPVQHALIRGSFHAASGLMVAILLYLYPRFIFLCTLTAATAALLCLEIARLRLPSLNLRFFGWFTPLLREQENSKLTGSSYFLIGSLATAILFPREIAVLAILFLSFGDPAASIVGAWRGRIKLWGKTVEGSIACLIVCLLTASIAAVIFKSLPPIAIVVGAFIATIAQLLPLSLNDNITIPLASATTMLLTSRVLTLLHT